MLPNSPSALPPCLESFFYVLGMLGSSPWCCGCRPFQDHLLLVQRKSGTDQGKRQLFRPLSTQAWVCVGLVFLVLYVVVAVASLRYPHARNADDPWGNFLLWSFNLYDWQTGSLFVCPLRHCVSLSVDRRGTHHPEPLLLPWRSCLSRPLVLLFVARRPPPPFVSCPFPLVCATPWAGSLVLRRRIGRPRAACFCPPRGFWPVSF